MLTALDSSNAVLTQFLMVDEWDCSPHHLHSVVTQYSLPSYSYHSPFWSELTSWVHIASNLDHSKVVTHSFDSLLTLYLFIKSFHSHFNSWLVLWKSISTPWRSELILVDPLRGSCLLSQRFLLTTYSFLPPFSCTWSLSSFSAVFPSSLPG